MISFRYHLVTIVAVFLALALGVLMGTTVVNQGVIDDLQRRTEDASKRADELRNQVNALSVQARAWDQFGAVVQPLLIEGELASREVVLVTLEGVDVREVDQVRRTLQAAGASVIGVLVATARMGLPDDRSREELARLLGSSASKTPPQLESDAGEKLGERLAQGPGAGDVDVLEQLVSAGFIVLQGGEGSVGAVGGDGQGVVLLSGGEVEPAVMPDAFLSPLAAALGSFTAPVVAAETAASTYPFVPLVRADGGLDGQMATVDNADTVPGRIAVVLALRDLFAVPGSAGDYGIKQGASSLLPLP